MGLASGEAIARLPAVRVLSAEEVGLSERGWSGETPLWFYILREADVLHDGDQLGPVGGRIVGEVLVGLSMPIPSPSDPSSPSGLRRSRPGAQAPSGWPTSSRPSAGPIGVHHRHSVQVRQRRLELGARADAELHEHLAQVVLGGAVR